MENVLVFHRKLPERGSRMYAGQLLFSVFKKLCFMLFSGSYRAGRISGLGKKAGFVSERIRKFP